MQDKKKLPFPRYSFSPGEKKRSSEIGMLCPANSFLMVLLLFLLLHSNINDKDFFSSIHRYLTITEEWTWNWDRNWWCPNDIPQSLLGKKNGDKLFDRNLAAAKNQKGQFEESSSLFLSFSSLSLSLSSVHSYLVTSASSSHNINRRND